jgi:hypothetical protein
MLAQVLRYLSGIEFTRSDHVLKSLRGGSISNIPPMLDP